MLVPSHPGYDKSARPDWMRNVRDIAVVYQALLAERDLGAVSLVGLGFGGWIAAEMATMAPRAFRRLVLVGAMGLKPERGEIADQALSPTSTTCASASPIRRCSTQAYGAEPPTPTLEQWDLNREMTFRIAWKPYMYNPSLPQLLGGVATPTLVVWGRERPHRAARVRRALRQGAAPTRGSRSSRTPATSSTWRSPASSRASSPSS